MRELSIAAALIAAAVLIGTGSFGAVAQAHPHPHGGSWDMPRDAPTFRPLVAADLPDSGDRPATLTTDTTGRLTVSDSGRVLGGGGAGQAPAWSTLTWDGYGCDALIKNADAAHHAAMGLIGLLEQENAQLRKLADAPSYSAEVLVHFLTVMLLSALVGARWTAVRDRRERRRQLIRYREQLARAVNAGPYR